MARLAQQFLDQARYMRGGVPRPHAPTRKRSRCSPSTVQTISPRLLSNSSCSAYTSAGSRRGGINVRLRSVNTRRIKQQGSDHDVSCKRIALGHERGATEILASVAASNIGLLRLPQSPHRADGRFVTTKPERRYPHVLVAVLPSAPFEQEPDALREVQ